MMMDKPVYRIDKSLDEFWWVFFQENNHFIYVAKFLTKDAEQRARDYAAWMNAGCPMPEAEPPKGADPLPDWIGPVNERDDPEDYM